MMRVTGGEFRGRVLRGEVGESVRPTSERAREGLFSMLGQDLTNTRILDAFGGTGLLGIEAWSRGAKVTIVENDRAAVAEIRQRVSALGSGVDVKNGDVLALAPQLGIFDGILADPPWKLPVEPILAVLAPLAQDWLVLEAEDVTECPETAGALRLDRKRNYGRTTFWVYRRERS